MGFLGGYAFCTLDWWRIRLVSAVQFLYLEFGKIPSINEFHYRARFFARATKRDWIEMSLRVYFLILPLWVCICGCAKWEAPEIPQRSIFPESRIAPDAVGMEVALAQLDSRQKDDFELFWNQLDQQALPLELRKRLDQNGLRVAVMASSPPTILHQLIDPPPILPQNLNSLEKQLYLKGLLRKKQRMISHDRISNREGELYSIPVSDIHPQFSWNIRNGDMETPGAGEAVRGGINITTFPQGDGTVKLMFEFEIHHGRARPQIAERSFFKENRQTIHRIRDLKFEIVLLSGESIVLAPTADVTDLGALFFGAAPSGADRSDSDPKLPPVPFHRLLLVRIVQTQMDDLFNDSRFVEKLTTTFAD